MSQTQLDGKFYRVFSLNFFVPFYCAYKFLIFFQKLSLEWDRVFGVEVL